MQPLPLRLDLRDDPVGEVLVARIMAALEVAHAHRGAPLLLRSPNARVRHRAGDSFRHSYPRIPHVTICEFGERSIVIN